MLTQTIPSYLYVEYNDDENLQAFVDAFNTLAQEYVTWFATVGLPVYTGLSADLLDWVAQGLYDQVRPLVPSEAPRLVGPYNTWAFNTLPYNGHAYVLNSEYELASDDVFKRVITWNFFKGDGRDFSVTWLKRRIERFLYGVDGEDIPVSETYVVSVEFVGGNVIEIRLPGFGDLLLAGRFAYLLKTGVLQTPFQYIFNVTL